MLKRILGTTVFLPVLLLSSCSTGSGAAVGRAVTETAVIATAYVVEGLTSANCEGIGSGTAREACQSNFREAKAANSTTRPASESDERLESFASYKARRDAELARDE
jgi:hypothetical protein